MSEEGELEYTHRMSHYLSNAMNAATLLRNSQNLLVRIMGGYGKSAAWVSLKPAESGPVS